MSKEPSPEAKAMAWHLSTMVLGSAFSNALGKALQQAMERGYEGIEVRFVKKVEQ